MLRKRFALQRRIGGERIAFHHGDHLFISLIGIGPDGILLQGQSAFFRFLKQRFLRRKGVERLSAGAFFALPQLFVG